jgi:hypothetical protein
MVEIKKLNGKYSNQFPIAERKKFKAYKRAVFEA